MFSTHSLPRLLSPHLSLCNIGVFCNCKLRNGGDCIAPDMFGDPYAPPPSVCSASSFGGRMLTTEDVDYHRGMVEIIEAKLGKL